MHRPLQSAPPAKKLEFPPFVPNRLLRNGHVQTVAGLFFPGEMTPYAARQRRVPLADGDQVVLHDDRPAGWQRGDRVAMMIHGLGGSHGSGYMRRIAHKLNDRGVRAFRLDLRGCGAGFGLARMPYYSGCSDDAAAALRWIGAECPESPITLLGFSMGGNVTLKLLGEIGTVPLAGLDSAVAVSPPVDLEACSRAIQQRSNRVYDWHFVRRLMNHMRRQRQHLPDSPAARFHAVPRTLRQFDDAFTAPVCGFGNVENYYRECSSARFVAGIRLPTLIVSAHDDPFIPSEPLERLPLPPQVELHLTDGGGHLGFIGRAGVDADRRWLDWRLVDWVVARDDQHC